MDNLLKKYPFPKKDKQINFSYPEYSIDLHGYFVREIYSKMEWLINHSIYQKFHVVKIITGKGTGVINREVKKILNTFKNKKLILEWKDNDIGSILVKFKL
jgi:dsDNA-specific endonuclease/ATPase MutS2